MISNERAKVNQQKHSGLDSKCTITHVKSKDSHVYNMQVYPGIKQNMYMQEQ